MVKKILKICILAPSRWGKDTAAEILGEHFGFNFKPTSETISEILIYDKLKDKYNYKTPLECFEDRINHRSDWYNIINEYNSLDKTRLVKKILETTDIYVGLRDSEQIEQCIKEKLFDLIIWIDASERLPTEDSSSFNIDKRYADIIIENNSDYNTFKEKVIRLGNILTKTDY
jgi:hypothetical protein